MGEVLTRHRFAIQTSMDSLSWFAALWLATFLRYELDISKVDPAGVLAIGLVAVVLQILIGSAVGLYLRRWRYGTFDEVRALLGVVAVVTPVVVLVNLVVPKTYRLPTSACISGGIIALGFMAAARVVWRLLLDKWTRPDSRNREPVIVFGAGQGGEQAITAMHLSGPYEPVVILDDDPARRRLRLKGVTVQGDRTHLADVAKRTGAKKVIVAIPSANASTMRELAALADQAGLAIMTLPRVEVLLGGGVAISDIKPLTEADILGRREHNLDIEAVAGYLSGKRVLVTGAGGSIGSELCRQIVRFKPAELIMLDRDESALQAVQLSIEGNGLLDDRNLVLANIRDPQRLHEVFTEHEPHVVFHAAALKHVTLLEMHPDEGWKTNVWGTHNMLEVAGRFGVERFVNVSTDKAADPTSILGLTKRLAEQLTSHASQQYDGTYLSVRFGNVLGSRGSVLPLFRAQIAAGGPVTVTDPEVTRFFMTIPEACELVVQAGALSRNGNVMVLDMGEPVLIAEMARRLIDQAEEPVEIVYTGLRPGEKLHEVLFSDDEVAHESGHDLIKAVDVPPLSPDDVAERQRVHHSVGSRVS